MSNRDDFSPKTKGIVAARAAYRCSIPTCRQPTSGPSDEAEDAVISIGDAAHISGAASGPGARRYDPTMSPEERCSLSNAIWLCANHARMIDRDEATYTIDDLHRIKQEHEELSIIHI